MKLLYAMTRLDPRASIDYEFSDIGDLTEEEDPLFGDIEDDKTLKKVTTKKRKLHEVTVGSTRTVKGNSFSGNIIQKKTVDILQQLKSNVKSNLEKELGFSLRNTKSEPEIIKSRGFQKLLQEVQKEKKITDIIRSESIEEEKKINVEIQISEWIDEHVEKKFLNVEAAGVKINQKWILSLRKTLHRIVRENNQVFEEDEIIKSILKYPEYCNFKCFKQMKFREESVNVFMEYMLDEPNLKTLLHSSNVQYVENFSIKTAETGTLAKKQIYEVLGCDVDLFLNKGVVSRSFDDRSYLPSMGCGFELLKFVQLLNFTKFTIFNKEETVRSLILLCSDYNVKFDNTHYNYHDGSFTGQEIGILKLRQFRNDPILFSLLNDTLYLEPEIWFELIRLFPNSNSTDDILLKGRLILAFLLNNNSYIAMNFDAKVGLHDIFEIVLQYLNRWSLHQLEPEDESLLEVIKLKVELIKDWILINQSTFKEWEKDIEKKEVIENLGKFLNRIKNHFFQKVDKSLNAIVPQCKKTLDFIYHEISISVVHDAFAE